MSLLLPPPLLLLLLPRFMMAYLKWILMMR
jgi:hypothetical protein